MTKQTMIIRQGEKMQFHVCPGKDCNVDLMENIKRYPSEAHAVKKGWVKTRDIEFCAIDKPFAFVCPSCSRFYQWKPQGIDDINRRRSIER